MGRVGFFPSPGELNSGNILAGQPTANKSPPRAGFVNKDRVLLYFKMVPLLLSVPEAQEGFSLVHTMGTWRSSQR